METFRMRLRRTIEGLRPYPSLLLLAVPIAIVEPLKLAAVAVAGKGHWIAGTAMIVACYAFSLLVVEQLFVIVKPKLLTITWFAKLWEEFVFVRARAWRIIKTAIGFRSNRKPFASSLWKRAAPAAKPVLAPKSARR
ncbi:hypothetical protein [Bradyrhizobium sp. RD5-C2]|uniref:hypothetical protein n=1 Tax=Bradyrhizobium sp. RD5-C2 TaxID=244562 RepID=UPI001CC38EAA|nr:hypothetical protein [Bradyrhizobium sp. RD5-C2]